MNLVKTGFGHAIETPRDFERVLRQEGFSRARAKAIAAKGFRSSHHSWDTVEVQSLVQSLGVKTRKLCEGLDTLCGGKTCKSEMKQRPTHDIEECNRLRRDLIGTNDWRWKARKELYDATRAFERAIPQFMRRFNRERGLSFSLDLVSLAQNLVGLVRRASPLGWAKTAYDVASIVRTLSTYNGDLAREYRQFATVHLSNINTAWHKVQHMESGFKKMVDKYKREGCGNLFARYFNQPAKYRF